MAVTALVTQGDALLDAATDALVAATTGHAAPGFAFLSHGPPNLELCCDDGLVAVWLDSITHEPLNAPTEDPGCLVENYAFWTVGVYRCWPSGDQAAPTAGEYDTATEDLLRDAWALLTEFYDRNRAGTLLPGCDCQTVAFGALTPSEAQGGCAGWEFRLKVDLSCLSDTGS